LIASPAFDAGASELWTSLCLGLTMQVVDKHARVNPEELVSWIADNAIHVSFMTTPLAQQVLQVRWPSHSALKILYTGGDKLLRGSRFPASFQLVNILGPTECTVNCTFYFVKPGEENPPIGRAVDNCKLYVLDQQGRVLPIGVPGELWIGMFHFPRCFLIVGSMVQRKKKGKKIL
jgi:non-ribosomal peptide synthetase component F